MSNIAHAFILGLIAGFVCLVVFTATARPENVRLYLKCTRDWASANYPDKSWVAVDDPSVANGWGYFNESRFNSLTAALGYGILFFKSQDEKPADPCSGGGCVELTEEQAREFKANGVYNVYGVF